MVSFNPLLQSNISFVFTWYLDWCCLVSTSKTLHLNKSLRINGLHVGMFAVKASHIYPYSVVI